MRGDATFQVLDALRRNRRKRRQRAEFLVHGVRAIDAAIANRWPLTGVVVRAGGKLSRWATGVLASSGQATRHELADALFDQLADRDEPSELIAVAALRTRRLDDISGAGPLLVLDRPASPGNLGALIRSADAFGAAGVVVLGHAADPFDPRSVRASQGSMFAVPVLEAGGAAALEPWLRASGRRVVGLDEHGPVDVDQIAKDRPVAIVLGNERSGLAAGVRALCDEVAAIPMRSATATSLNVAVAGSIALYAMTR